MLVKYDSYFLPRSDWLCNCYQIGNPAQSRSASGRSVVYQFFTSCQKDFTTGIQVILRICFLKLGTVKQGRA